MNIFYVASVCSKKKFEQLYKESKIKPQQQVQKFHHLFIKGLEQLEHQVQVMSALPLSRSSSSKRWSHKEKDLEGNIDYHYLPFINFPVVKQLFIFIAGFFTCFKWSMQKENKVLICDVLTITSSVPALLISKIFGFKSVAIVTDLPSFMVNYSADKNRGLQSFVLKLYEKICNFFINKYDLYMILTEQMNEVVNRKMKPYIVIEGMVDSDMKDVINKLGEKREEKIIIYAGALYEKYGVKKLIEAFRDVKIQEARLWLYGAGELEEEIRKYETVDKRIKYFGVVPNIEVVEAERRATLLVNPRSSTEAFTKFSFPSKNMEYMVSGTPLLTTKLPGMKEEYYDYIYLLEDECIEGITEALHHILLKSKEELFFKGFQAKEFVLREKNNVIQAKKLMEKL